MAKKTDAAPEAVATFIVLSPIKKDGKRYDIGAKIDLTSDEADELGSLIGSEQEAAAAADGSQQSTE